MAGGLGVAARLRRSARARIFTAIRSTVVGLGEAGGQRDASQAAQRLLAQQYRMVHDLGLPLPRFAEVGFRVFSQFDEDGILVFLFALLGVTNKICVELAFGMPDGANTTNLICNWGWRGLLLEGSEGMAAASERFFARHRDTWYLPPRIVSGWITPANINSVIQANGVEGEIDLFSLDIDGIDYWVWKSLEVVRPRVVVAEYSGLWGPDRAVTVPDVPSFATSHAVNPLYGGASLLAFVKLGREKGYRLVGVNRQGFNAFFVRDDVGVDIFPEVSPEEIDAQPDLAWTARYRDEHFPNGLPGEWVSV